MSKLTEEIKSLTKELTRDKPILILYDEGGTLSGVVSHAKLDGIKPIIYQGSYLQIRATIEREDPKLRGKWLIYVPERSLPQSWLRDYELLGAEVDLNLERFLATRFGLKTNREAGELLSGIRGKALADNWDKAIGKVNRPISKDMLIDGLLTTAFDLGPGFDLGRAVLTYVSDQAVYSARLSEMGLHQAFADQISTELGLSNVIENGVVSVEKVAAATLFSELVMRSDGLGKKEFESLLPLEEKRPLWVKLAGDWRQNVSLRDSFIDWSEKLEKKYAVRDKLAGLENLLHVQSFKVIDDVLLDELCARLSPGGAEAYEKQVDTIKSVASARSKTIWAETGRVRVWHAIKSGVDLFSASHEALRSLEEMVDNTIGDYLSRYQASDGWWRIDGLRQSLAASGSEEDERIFDLFVKPADIAYGEWLRKLTVRFAEAASQLSSWSIPQVMNQRDFWRLKVEASKERVAVLMIDALRYDLAQSLMRWLLNRGFEVNVTPMLATIPSVTEVGMGMLLPRPGKDFGVSIKDGKIKPRIDSQSIASKSDRKKWLEQVLGSEVTIFELDKVRTLSKAKLWSELEHAMVTVVTSQEIDRAGTFLPDIGIDYFEQLVGRLVEVVAKLHGAGIGTVLVATDHGFLLLPRALSVDVTNDVDSSAEVAMGRRYAIGKPRQVPSLISFTFQGLGFMGDGWSLFPRGLTVLSMPGEIKRFVHGGISPQEVGICVIESKSKPEVEEQKVKITAGIPDRITNAVSLIAMEPKETTVLTTPRTVRIEVWAGGSEPITASESRTIQFEPIKVKLVLSKAPEEVEVRLVDVETYEVLDRKSVKVELSGYDELL
ncbi:MAG: PglZ domain-containing protein [Actinobacteria bacterium]|nr:PglZ domain-containing protein [Actinomycetota bacterium]